MKLTRKLAALAMAVLLAVSLTACSPKKPPQAAAWSSPPRWIPTPPVW